MKSPLAVAIVDRGARPPRHIALTRSPDALRAVADIFLREAEQRLTSARRPLDQEYARAELALLRIALGSGT